jgi:hypothetical protein
MISKILNQIVLALSLLIWFLLLPGSVVAQEEESSEKWAPLAVKEVVESHDQTLILKGGDLMVRQQIVKAAKLFVLRWGRERGLGDAWWEDKQEYQQAVDELLRIGDQIMLEKFESGVWLTNIWTEYTAKNFTGEQASAIAEHFKTEYGMVQRRLMEWYLGETTLFYYTFTDRWDYRLEETRKQLEALQKEARTRVPNDKLSWKAGEKEAYTFIACSPDSEYCPGVKYWKMLAIPMMGAVFRYMEDITREIKAAMEARRDLVEPYFLAFERSQASQ